MPWLPTSQHWPVHGNAYSVAFWWTWCGSKKGVGWSWHNLCSLRLWSVKVHSLLHLLVSICERNLDGEAMQLLAPLRNHHEQRHAWDSNRKACTDRLAAREPAGWGKLNPDPPMVARSDQKPACHSQNSKQTQPVSIVSSWALQWRTRAPDNSAGPNISKFDQVALLAFKQRSERKSSGDFTRLGAPHY